MPRGNTEGSSSSGAANSQIDRFETRGSVDWVGLVSKPLSYTGDVLSRYSAAGADLYTIEVGKAFATYLPLGKVGRHNVEKALAARKTIAGLGKVLWFGWGKKCFTWDLGTTDQGLSLMAICAALAAGYHEDFAAEVLHNIGHNGPKESTPSVKQWLSVVRACSGIFSTTKFPQLVETFMRLGLNPDTAFLSSYRHWPWQNDLADAIIGVGKVAKGDDESIAIVGSAPAVGWLAAIAEWLFDLPLIIQDMQGNLLYSKCGELQKPRIEFKVRSDPEESSNEKIDGVKIVRRTYQIRDCREIFLVRKQDQIGAVCSGPGGRLPWDCCLAGAFGSYFTRLLEVGTHVGMAFGCAARIFEGTAKSETGIPSSPLAEGIDSSSFRYFIASSGHGLIFSVVHWFPELGQLRPYMDNGVGMTLTDAHFQYLESMNAIMNHCSLDFPSSRHEGRCLLVMFQTILAICGILTGVRVADNLVPELAGIDMIYQEQSASYRRRESGCCCHPFIRSGNWAMFPFDASFIERMRYALQLFSRSRVHVRNPPETTALCANGICAYVDVLQDFSLDPESVGLVNVVPGQIGRNNTTFRVIEDGDTPKDVVIDPTLGALSTPHFDSVSVLLTERAKALTISFKFYDKSSKAGEAVYVGPAYLLNTISKARGKIACYHGSDEGTLPDRQDVTIDISQRPRLKLRSRDGAITCLDCGDHGDHFLAVALVAAAKHGSPLLLREDECIGCTIDRALKPPSKSGLTEILLLRRSFKVPKTIKGVDE